MPERIKENWHLSKNVPIAIIFALIAQSVSAIWFVSELNSKVKLNERDIAENKLDIANGNSVEPRLVRVETDISYIRRSVDDNKEAMLRLNNTLTELLRETRSSR